MKIISLNKGLSAFVDNSDFEYISQFKWFAITKSKYSKTKYAVRHNKWIDGKAPRPQKISMHREIALRHGIIEGKQCVDHIDNNGLNNTTKNLRPATTSQNTINRNIQLNNKSGYRGVTYYRPYQKWRAYIKVNRRFIHIGYFSTKEEAALAYNDLAKCHHKEFARLNIIKPHPKD